MASLFGDDSSIHGSTLFGQNSVVAEDPDPWASASPGAITPVAASSVSTLLRGANVPEVYTFAFDDAVNNVLSNDSDASKDLAPVAALNNIFVQLNLLQTVRNKIYSIIRVTPYDSNRVEESNTATASKIDRGTWNVALALAAFAQKGSTEETLSLALVDFSRNSLPHLALPKYQALITKKQRETQRKVSSQDPSASLIGKRVSSQIAGVVWQSSIDPSNYNPLSKNTITVSLVPKREGTLFFRHVNYMVEGFVPSSLFAAASTSTSSTPSSSNGPSSTTKFKVVRRYSDFDWLLDSLQKKYPFRLLPVLPPKRLSDGHYLSSDDHFLERRRKGLQRFINLLIKHPLLKNERLVAVFLSVETELSVWRSSGSALELHEEYHNRIISTDFVSSWDEQARMEHWRDVKHAAEAARDTLTQLCILADRISRRNTAMALDYGKVSSVLTAFNQSIPLLYKGGDQETAGDLPIIGETVRNVSNYLTTSSSLLLDEGASLDSGLLEDVKVLRDTVLAVLEIFLRYERIGGDTIAQLERRIQQSESRLNGSNGNDARASERDKLVKSIDADKRTIKYQKNRSWLIRQTITEELDLHQRTQYLIAKLLSDWSNSAVKFSESHADNWAALTRDIVIELPLS